MIDLHVHTQASDGTWTPERALSEAAGLGLHALSFTDHDSVDSVSFGMQKAGGHHLRFIAAAEFSAGSRATEILHILGYGIDPDHPDIVKLLEKNQAAWTENEGQSLQKLAALGIEISPERYEYWTLHREKGGWPTLNCLVELGLVTGHRDYFGKYFGSDRPAYVETDFAGHGEAVAAIRAAGGVPVLAHPGAYDESGRTILDRPGFLDAMVELGIEGFECLANENSPEVTAYLLDYCRRRDLLITGGSDCHGEFAGRVLGRPPVPDEYLPPLLERLQPGTYV